MEFVFVVPREVLFPTCTPQGFLPFAGRSVQGWNSSGAADGTSRAKGSHDAAPELETLATPERFHDLVRTHGFFVERERAERTPAWKQVIPYTLVQAGEEILLVRRRKAGGEQRLHDKLSIGIGGHVEPVDAATADEHGESDPLAAGSRRELEEELDVRGPMRLRALGLLNDDSNPVGAVHLGLVQVAQVEGTVQVREEDVLAGRMVTPGELETLLSEGANFETWSAILVERLRALLPDPITSTRG